MLIINYFIVILQQNFLLIFLFDILVKNNLDKNIVIQNQVKVLNKGTKITNKNLYEIDEIFARKCFVYLLILLVSVYCG